MLIASTLGILIFIFAAPAVVKRYAEEAAVFEPRDLSVESSTPEGIRARIQGEFTLDSSRVVSRHVRVLGRFATWIAREVETGQSEVQVYLPEYGDLLIGIASLPSIKVSIRDGHVNRLDFLADLSVGDVGGIRSVANDWLGGRIEHLRLRGTTTTHLKSGLLSLGMQTLSDILTFEEKDFPALPEINITKAIAYDDNSSSQAAAVAVEVSITALFDSPFTFTIPPLGFDVLVPNCLPGDPYILVAAARTGEVEVRPRSPTSVDSYGIIRKIPNELITACPGQKSSPLDILVKNYINGLRTTIYIRGADAPSPDTPAWIVELLKSVMVPLPFTGHALVNLVKNFSMSDVNLSLPDPMAEPGTPEAQPKISALVKALIKLPEQMNFKLDVPRVRAMADVFYHDKKLGFLDLYQWLPANTTLVEDSDSLPALSVGFHMQDAPLQVTDENTLTEVIQTLILGKKAVRLRVVAAVDAEVSNRLGTFTLRKVPAEGSLSVKVPYGGSIDQLNPKIESLEIGPTTESSVLVKATMNFTNPTPYSAIVPMADLVLLYNGTAVGHVVARDVSLIPGLNTGIHVDLVWNPLAFSGANGVDVGRKMVSRYISGFNTTVNVRSYWGTIPALPKLGQAMSKLELEIPIPKVPTPDDGKDPDEGDDEGRSRFIQDATLHLWSSTAEFTLYSPLPDTAIFVTSIDASAFYEKKEPIGTIDYNVPIKVPPGISRTPQLPVNLDLSGVGYDAVRRALGRSLKMDAEAKVGVRIRQYKDIITYHGTGISANVRI